MSYIHHATNVCLFEKKISSGRAGAQFKNV